MSKQLPTDAIANELAGASAFFPKQQVQPTPPVVTSNMDSGEPMLDSSPRLNSPFVVDNQEAQVTKQQQQHPKQSSIMSEGKSDVVTSLLHDVNLKSWREVIENTETQNSALRLTSEERYAVEDVINELRRQEKVKTSMNEIARLGLLLLIHDFKQHKRQSLLYQVKKS